MLFHLLLAVVLELLLANGLLDFFRGQGGQGLPLWATVPHPLAALAPSPRGRGLKSALAVTLSPLPVALAPLSVALAPLSVTLVPLSVALVPLRVALVSLVARLALALLSAPSLRFGFGAVVARAHFEARDDLLLDLFPYEPLEVAQVGAFFARDERYGLAGF